MLDWDYKKKQVHLSIPGYAKKALKEFKHEQPARSQDSWRPGKQNYAVHWTRHHAGKHHKSVRREFLTPYIVLKMI